MIYYGTYTIETIVVRPTHNKNNCRSIEMCKNVDNATFDVIIDDGDNVCMWTFMMKANSLYEVVKHTIFDMIFKCDTIIELCSVLDDVFTEDFSEFIVYEDDCDDNCKACHYKN